ncbi:hypothetical protein IFHNHDMJ_00271 [Synechococcus sp. CBW1107]|nr:hypothetical protein IFHNHDMJ_00271 [Synechococcus sp. CBW1107]
MACPSARLVAPPPVPSRHERSANGGRLSSLKLDAKRSGYLQLMRWAAEFGSRPVFAVESTGCYGAGLCCGLLDCRPIDWHSQGRT